MYRNLYFFSVLRKKYECTIDQELTDAGSIGAGRRFMFTHQVGALCA